MSPFPRRAMFIAAIVVLAISACASERDHRIDNALDQLERINPESADSVDGAIDEFFDECLEDADVDFSAILGDAEGDEEAIRMMQTLLDCNPDLDRIGGFVDGMMGSIELSLDNQIEISTTEGSCLVRHILDSSDDPAHTLAVGNTEAEAEIFILGIEACFSNQNRAILVGEAGPQSYGENARLDLMFDGCEQGDMRLCDILVMNAAFGSEYSEFGVDCGGAIPKTFTSCSSEGAVDAISGFADPDSPGLEQMSTECVAGDLTACDLLFLVAPFASDYLDVGKSCGGRIVIAAIPDCRTSLGP